MLDTWAFPSLFYTRKAGSHRRASSTRMARQSLPLIRPASEDHGRFETSRASQPLAHRRTKPGEDALPPLVGREANAGNDGQTMTARAPAPRTLGRSASCGDFADKMSRGLAVENLDFTLEAVARAVASTIEPSPEAAGFLEPVQDKHSAGCSVDSVRGFLGHIFRMVKLPEECLVRSVVVLKRLAAKHPEVKLTAKTWRPALLGILLVVGKVADDELPRNSEWTHLFRDFALRRINALEVLLLKALDFRIGVGCSEYVATYFDLQQQTYRELGGAQEAMSQPLGMKLALEVAQARRAAKLSAQRQREVKNLQRNSRDDAKDSSKDSSGESSTTAPAASKKRPTYPLRDRISAADLRLAWAKHPLIDKPPTLLHSHFKVSANLAMVC